MGVSQIKILGISSVIWLILTTILLIGSLAFGIYSGYKVMDIILDKGTSEVAFGVIFGTVLYLGAQIVDCHLIYKAIIEYYQFPSSSKVSLFEKFKNDRWFLLANYILLVVTIKNILIGAFFQIMLAADFVNSYITLTVILVTTIAILVVGMCILVNTIN